MRCCDASASQVDAQQIEFKEKFAKSQFVVELGIKLLMPRSFHLSRIDFGKMMKGSSANTRKNVTRIRNP